MAPTNPTGTGSNEHQYTLPPTPELTPVQKQPNQNVTAGVTSTYTVVNTNDAGFGSLREAISQANANPGPDIINFEIGTPGTVQTIGIASGLAITEEVLIDGWHQGVGVYTGPPLVVIDGSSTTNTPAFVVQAPNVTIRGLSIVNFDGGVGVGIWGASATNCWVYGNYFGVLPDSSPAPTGNIGVYIRLGASGNLIGTNADGINDANERNVIAGNPTEGIRIEADGGNTVAGNYIGVDPTGSLAGYGNVYGILIYNSIGNIIGGNVQEARNIISGNVGSGIILGPGATSTVISGNFIGTNVTGDSPIPNSGDGVTVNNAGSGTMIGGSTPGERNVISGNSASGIGMSPNISGSTIRGNYIGVDASGTSALGNNGFGVVIANGSSGNTIGGSGAGQGNVISGNSIDGISIAGNCTNNVIRGNLIGTDASGSNDLGNAGSGIALVVDCDSNMIGGGNYGDRNTISGNDIGIYITQSDGNTIRGNYIGTDSGGTVAIGNTLDGVDIFDGSKHNVIGGSVAGEGNLISGNNQFGVNIAGADSSIISGNLIGTDIAGTSALPNWNGMWFDNSDGNIVGGTTPAERNLVSGNTQNGIFVGWDCMNTRVIGNFVGTDIDGYAALGNGHNGVILYESGTGNKVGGSTSVERNILSGNGFGGAAIALGSNGNFIQGNFIGTDVAGSTAIPNGTGVDIWDNYGGNIIGGATEGERNVISGNHFDGITINSSTGESVRGNYIGMDVAGTFAIGNGTNGVILYNNSVGNVIGGPTADYRNVISGNDSLPDTWGVALYGGPHDNTIQNNYIGVNSAGTTAVPNGVGVVLGAAWDNIIESNVISGSNGYYFSGVDGYGNGIVISGNAAYGNIFRSNLIGTDAAGVSAIPNTTGGILVRNTAHHNLIGGTSAAEGNVISGNTNRGIYILGADTNVVSGNLIGLDSSGISALPNSDGVVIEDADTNIVGGYTAGERNTISGNPEFGVFIDRGSMRNVVLGNYIGTDNGGTVALPNGTGVKVGYNSSENTIGSNNPAEGNLISGNSITAITVRDSAAYTSILGNLIGTDHDGTGAIPNANGIYLREAFDTQIGNSTGGGNLISGNLGDGIGLWSDWCRGTKIHGNRIGVLADGVTPLGNGDSLSGGIGIYGAVYSVIGGTDPGEAGNIIANNAPYGVAVHSGTQNEISANSIYNNAGLGIDLFPAGVTPNDSLDLDTGPNNLQNTPVIEFAASDLEGIAGTLHSAPSENYRIEFFTNTTGDPSWFGEGETYIGSVSVTTDASGNASFYSVFPGGLVNGQVVTATATDDNGNTSEFSGGVLTQPKFKIFGTHYVVNTTLSGIPLHPGDGVGVFHTSTSIPPAFRSAIIDGMNTWGALPSLTFVDAGDTPSSDWAGVSDSLNNIVWITSDWELITEAPSNAIAITRVLYNSLTGELTDVDMAFNAESFSWATSGALDMIVRNVSTHEGGHTWGLGDIYNPVDPGYVSFMGSGNEDETMYGLINEGETNKTDLNTGDIDGIDYIFSHIPASRINLMMVFDGSATFSSTYNALTPSVNTAVELIDKMRPGDRIGVVRMPDQVVYPLTEITGMVVRENAKAAISGISAGGSCALGAGLTAAQAQLTTGGAPNHASAAIVFSAGEEDTLPTAFSALPALISGGTSLYTLGFSGSPGQIVCDSVASATGGGYYLTDEYSVGTTVDHIWNRLTGQMLLSDTTVASADVPPYPQPGLKWQGAIDPGIGRIQPGLKWQGSAFRLTLIAPDLSIIDSAVAAASSTDGIEFHSGPTYQYYDIEHPMPGIWTLVVQGLDYPPSSEPLDLYMTATRTDLTMDLDLDDAIYTPGESIEISTTLLRGGLMAGDLHVVGGSTIPDARVIAVIQTPGGTVDTVWLTYTGEGVYRALYPNTGQPGSYRIEIFASKEGDFQRQSTQSVYVTAPFTCPTSIVVPVDPGECSAVVNYGIEDPSIVCNPPSGTAFPVGSTLVSCGPAGGGAECTFIVTVLNPAPSVTMSAPPAGSLYPVGTTLSLVGHFTDNPADVHTAIWRVDGTVIPGTVTESTGLVSDQYTFTEAGVYGVTLVVEDQCGGRDSAQEVGGMDAIVVVYDPSAGFVTGGGWIMSPPGAYTPDPVLSDTATFGFVSKYHKGKDTPSGQTEFRFKVANFRFTSTSYDWLVIAGARAQYTGSGLVNDAGDYKFTLSAVDGDLLNVRMADKFRMKIWDRSSGLIIYDNQLGDADTNIATTSIAGGAIVIHKPNNVRYVEQEPGAENGNLPAEYALGQNYPNPFNPTTMIAYDLPVDSRVLIRVYNTLGELVTSLEEGEQQAGYYNREFNASTLSSGLYVLRFEAVSIENPQLVFTRTRKMLLVR